MTRIKIDLPETFSFETIIQLQVGDMNYGNHMGNDVVLRLAHESRVRLLRSHGWTEMDFSGVGLIMADSVIQYKSEGFYGDNIRIHVQVCNFSRVGFDMYFRMFNETTKKDLAHVKTGMVCFDYNARKIKEVPEKVKTAFQS